MISAIIVVGWIVAAITWKLLGLNPYASTGKILGAPSLSHWFGTEYLGRSVFARTVAGSDTALLVGPLGSALATAGGSALGVIAGYYDKDITNFKKWDAAAAGVPGVTGFMYTTWQHKFTHLEEYGKAIWRE